MLYCRGKSRTIGWEHLKFEDTFWAGWLDFVSTGMNVLIRVVSTGIIIKFSLMPCHKTRYWVALKVLLFIITFIFMWREVSIYQLLQFRIFLRKGFFNIRSTVLHVEGVHRCVKTTCTVERRKGTFSIEGRLDHCEEIEDIASHPLQWSNSSSTIPAQTCKQKRHWKSQNLTRNGQSAGNRAWRCWTCSCSKRHTVDWDTPDLPCTYRRILFHNMQNLFVSC